MIDSCLLNKALVDAIDYDSYDNVKALIAQGADIHINNDKLLIKLCRDGNTKQLKYFIDQGLDLSRGIKGAITAVCAGGFTEHLLILLDAMKKQSLEIAPHEIKCLSIASKNGHFDAVKTLINAGVKANCTMTPLLHACNMEHHEIAYFLHKNGASFNNIEPDAYQSKLLSGMGFKGVAHSTKEWIINNITGSTLDELYSYDKNDLPILITALHLQVKENKLSLLTYLEKCPDWQKEHVLKVIGNSI